MMQQMVPMPGVRLRPARPFSSTGMDYAGPFMIRCSAGRGQKRLKGYVSFFICMVTKAVHLEVVSNLTSEAFLAAFRRFVARRGLCKVMHSDNGTNFRGTATESDRLFSEASSFSHEVAEVLALGQVEWSFIPARSPSFRGLWETNVKSFKHHLYRAIGEAKLTYKEFSTVCASIEACLNLRPLCVLKLRPHKSHTQ